MYSIALAICLLVITCSGCASTSTFHPYPAQINPLIDKVKEDLPINLKREFKRKLQAKDKILYLLEAGRLAQIKGDMYLSKQNFHLAQLAIKQADDKALFSASGAIAQSSSILVNDNAIAYRPEGFERVMLNLYQAMNYIYQNEWQDAAVEVRKANLEQEQALNRHLKEINSAKKTAVDNKISLDIPTTVSSTYSKLDLAAGQVKNSFQNAYTFYVSGIIYEMIGQPNDAFIDYKKALEIFPNNNYLQKDVLRLDKEINQNQKPNTDNELIVLFEDDFIAQKEEVKIPIPVSLENLNLIAIAFPTYNVIDIRSYPLLLFENGQTIAVSEPICNLTSLALKSLKEKIPSITIHQLIRAASKGILVRQAQKEFGDIGALAASAYNYFSENADLRSWSSLPASAEIIRIPIAAGEHEFSFLQRETGATVYMKVIVKENIKKIIRIVRAGNKLYYINLT